MKWNLPLTLGLCVLALPIRAFLAPEWSVTRQDNDAYLAVEAPDSKTFRLGDKGVIDLETLFGTCKGKEECIVYNRFTLPEDKKLGFGVGVDWWFEAYLNGKKIWSTMTTGNGSSDFAAAGNLFVGDGKKGENLLAIRLRRGTGTGWAFAALEKNPAIADPFRPVSVTVDLAATKGKIKPMNAVNNGPRPERHTQSISNMRAWRAAKIPYARNHDASFYSGYGGEHTVDVHAIFPDFSKDPTDPASYVFAPTDKYLSEIQLGGSKVFYRLGSKIEHGIYKYGTRVPPDFKKWAVVCEHIIRHYTEGWANGYKWDIAYWEIWNEADLSFKNKQKPTWQGTEVEFLELYRTAALHLKKCFPHLKIGGPASFVPPWGENSFMERFLKYMTKDGERVPVDFYSWHLYTTNPRAFADGARQARALLDKYGYTQAENILNEWNYVKTFDGPEWLDSLKLMVALKGAVFVSAAMSTSQDAPLDMLMYYDARPCGMNGIFHQTFMTPRKGYYSFLAWAKLADLGTQVVVDTQKENNFYATAATDGKGSFALLLTRYSEYDEQFAADREVSIAVKGASLWGAKAYLLDETHDLTEIPYRTGKDGTIKLTMKLNTAVYIELKETNE